MQSNPRCLKLCRSAIAPSAQPLARKRTMSQYGGTYSQSYHSAEATLSLRSTDPLGAAQTWQTPHFGAANRLDMVQSEPSSSSSTTPDTGYSEVVWLLASGIGLKVVLGEKHGPVDDRRFAFACVLGGALLGMYLGKVLPKHHLGDDANDAIKLSMAMVATLAALVLGLMTASARSSLDDKEHALRGIAAQIILLDCTMAEYGTETQEARDFLKRMVAIRVSQIWPEENGDGVAARAVGVDNGIRDLQRKILALSPANDTQRWFQSAALQISHDIAAAQWSTFEQVDSQFHWTFLVIVVFWLTIVFVSSPACSLPKTSVPFQRYALPRSQSQARSI